MPKITTEEQAKVAILDASMTEIKQDIGDIKVEVKSISTQIQSMIQASIKEQAAIQARLTLLEREQTRLNGQSNLWRWLSPTLSAILSSAVTFLFLQYLQNIK